MRRHITFNDSKSNLLSTQQPVITVIIMSEVNSPKKAKNAEKKKKKSRSA